MPRSAGKLPTANSRNSSGLTWDISATDRYVNKKWPHAGATSSHNRRLPSAHAPAERSDPFDDHRLALAAGDAHRLQADLLVVGLHPVEQGAHDAGAGHPERV